MKMSACRFLLVAGFAVLVVTTAGCKPQISSLSATQGEPGKVITIRGSYFGNAPEANRVFLGDEREMHIVTAAPGLMRVMVPYDDPGSYDLRVETAEGASASRSFTVLPQAISTGVATAGAQAMDGLEDSYEWCVVVSSAIFGMVQSPYADDARESLLSLTTTLAESDAADVLTAEVDDLYAESAIGTNCHGLFLVMIGLGVYNRTEVDRITGTFEAFLDNFSSLVSRESPDPELEEALSRTSADIARARMFLPARADASTPKLWIDGVPDRLRPGWTYDVTAYALDDIVPDHANSGVDYLGVTVRYLHDGNTSILASDDIFVDWWLLGEPTIAQGYAQPLPLQFTVPSGASSADRIEFVVSASDAFANHVEIRFERRPNITYEPPHLSDASISPGWLPDRNALAGADVSFYWSDAGKDVASLKFEFFGEGVKDRSTFERSAQALGIVGSAGGEFTRSMSDFVSVSDVFREDRAYWAGMRMWLIDASGNESESGVASFFINGPGNEVVFNVTVADSETDGRKDDRFAFVTDTWFTYRLTPIGGQKTVPLRVGDVPPDGRITLRTWCVYSEVNDVGSALVQLGDGATFWDDYDGDDTSEYFDVRFDSQNPEEKVLRIRPPPRVDPPPPGS